MKFLPVIGLEIHAQLNTETKLFCSCKNEFDSPPNTNVCPICLGYPGTLPVLNKKAVEFAIKAGLALNCKINKESYFARKNYFYPDLPKGYQITQYEVPLCENGYLEINGKKIRIKRIHIEEDAGKSIHDKADYTKIDFNRSGVPLIEIVTEPDIESPDEAVEFLRMLRITLIYIGINDGNMQEGSLRCDSNISVRKEGQGLPDFRVEIKNLNSFRFLHKALDYEIRIQSESLNKGEKIETSTKLWDTKRNQTFVMRKKEEEFDYRYFPEPDLGALVVNDELIESIRKELPELPVDRRKRLRREYGLNDEGARFYTFNPDILEIFENTAKINKNIKKIDSWLRTEYMMYLKENNLEVSETKLSSKNLSELIELVDNGDITGKIAKDIFEDVINGKNPKDIIKEKGLEKFDDVEKLREMLLELIENNPKEVSKYKAGNKRMSAFFIGRIMAKTKGQANPKIINDLIREYLYEEE